MKPIIGIIFGGTSLEHAVSLLSAVTIIENIDHDKYDILQIGIALDGKIYVGPEVLMSLRHKKDMTGLAQGTISTNAEFPGVFIFTGDGQHVFQKVDLFFPITHGTFGEDGTLQGALEYSHVPYVGSRVLGSALGMDKIIMKKIFATYRLPQVPFLPFTKEQIKTDIIAVRDEILSNMHYPIFVKPANLGSSIGVKKVKTNGDLQDALDQTTEHSNRIIVEQGVANMREIECAVIGTRKIDVSTVGEVIHKAEFYNYKAKYEDTNTQMIIPAILDKVTISDVQSMAKRAFEILDLRGLARVDFFITPDELFINEVNTLPGFTADSMYPRLFESQGMSIKDLVQRLIDDALAKE